jgi:hypothetical protein
MKTRNLLLFLILSTLTGVCHPEDVIVFTCHQDFNSRIYILGMDGSVYDWFQYDMYRLCDLEVVSGEVHVVDAFAPRSYTLDLQNGDLDLIIDDWSLFYFYDIAFDGAYLYVTEWDLNRYLPNGSGASSASFSYDTFGSTYCDDRLWTLNEDEMIRAWDISGWPYIEEDSLLAFEPPSSACRGLSIDGEYFWSADALENQTGYIYCFDRFGTVIQQINEPAFTGWAACRVSGYQSAFQTDTWAALKRGYFDE